MLFVTSRFASTGLPIASRAAASQKQWPDAVPPLSPPLPQLVGRWFGPLAVADEVDLVGQVLLPLIDEVMALLMEIDAEALAHFRRVPGIFDRMIGMRRRKELEAEVAAARSTWAGRKRRPALHADGARP